MNVIAGSYTKLSDGTYGVRCCMPVVPGSIVHVRAISGRTDRRTVDKVLSTYCNGEMALCSVVDTVHGGSENSCKRGREQCVCGAWNVAGETCWRCGE